MSYQRLILSAITFSIISSVIYADTNSMGIKQELLARYAQPDQTQLITTNINGKDGISSSSSARLQNKA